MQVVSEAAAGIRSVEHVEALAAGPVVAKARASYKAAVSLALPAPHLLGEA